MNVAKPKEIATVVAIQPAPTSTTITSTPLANLSATKIPTLNWTPTAISSSTGLSQQRILPFDAEPIDIDGTTLGIQGARIQAGIGITQAKAGTYYLVLDAQAIQGAPPQEVMNWAISLNGKRNSATYPVAYRAWSEVGTVHGVTWAFEVPNGTTELILVLRNEVRLDITPIVVEAIDMSRAEATTQAVAFATLQVKTPLPSPELYLSGGMILDYNKDIWNLEWDTEVKSTLLQHRLIRGCQIQRAPIELGEIAYLNTVTLGSTVYLVYGAFYGQRAVRYYIAVKNPKNTEPDQHPYAYVMITTPASDIQSCIRDANAVLATLRAASN